MNIYSSKSSTIFYSCDKWEQAHFISKDLSPSVLWRQNTWSLALSNVQKPWPSPSAFRPLPRSAVSSSRYYFQRHTTPSFPDLASLIHRVKWKYWMSGRECSLWHFSQITNAFLIKKHTYHQVKLTVPCGDGQFNGGQLHVFPDLRAHLLGKGCVNAGDTGQLLPLTSCHSTTKGQLPAAQLGPPGPSADSPPPFSPFHTS